MTMIACHECGEPIDVPVRGELGTPERGARVCDDCGLLLDRFIEQRGPANDMHL